MVSAGIVICYALLPFIQASSREFLFTLFGIFVPIRINFYNLMSVIAAGMAAAGADWMLRDHPAIAARSTIPHLILPAITAAAIGMPLGLLEVSLAWWMIMAMGSFLTVLILIAEYISLDSQDARYPLALMVLSAVSYGVFLILCVVLRTANTRLFLMLLSLPPFFAFLCLRILHFRLGGHWRVEWAVVVTLIVAQCIIAFYYWPLTPVRYGLALLGPAYALIGIAASLEEHPNIRQVFYEPLFMLGIFWFLGIFIA